MAQPSWFDYVLGDLRWLAHPGSAPSVTPGEAAARAKPLTDLVSGIGRGIGGTISDMADMHDWRFGDPLPDLSKSRQAIGTVLRYTVPDPVHDPWGAGMMMAMGSGPHPDWPPKITDPVLNNRRLPKPDPSTAPVPGSGADFRYTPDPAIERMLRTTEAQGSLDRAIEAAKNKFQYPPTQLPYGGPRGGEYYANVDLAQSTPQHLADAKLDLPYNQWTTTTTDALAAQHKITPAELHRLWSERLTNDVRMEGAEDLAMMYDKDPAELYSTHLPESNVVDFGVLPGTMMRDYWRHVGNDRWQRVIGTKYGQTEPTLFHPSMLGPEIRPSVLNDFLDKVWGKDPKGWQPTRLTSDQMAEFLMDNKDAANVHGNLADIASGRFGKLDMTGQWRGFRDQDGFHSWERIPEWEDQINQSIMPLGAYGDAAMPKVALEREIIAPGHEHEYQIGSSVLVYGNKWTKGANGRWFRMTGPGIDQ